MESSNISGSRTVSRAAMLMCMTRTREEEKTLKAQLAAEEVRAAADAVTGPCREGGVAQALRRMLRGR